MINLFAKAAHGVLRHAQADRMLERWVACHNSRPGSPRVDWMMAWLVSLETDTNNRPFQPCCFSRSRRRKRWILPVAVLGNSATNSMKRGYL